MCRDSCAYCVNEEGREAVFFKNDEYKRMAYGVECFEKIDKNNPHAEAVFAPCL